MQGGIRQNYRPEAYLGMLRQRGMVPDARRGTRQQLTTEFLASQMEAVAKVTSWLVLAQEQCRIVDQALHVSVDVAFCEFVAYNTVNINPC
jgi:hypothetical protein